MRKFKVKPLVEAEQFTGENHLQILDILEENHVEAGSAPTYIRTEVNGGMTWHKGDWVVRGPLGNIFHATDVYFQQNYEETT